MKRFVMFCLGLFLLAHAIKVSLDCIEQAPFTVTLAIDAINGNIDYNAPYEIE